MFARIIGISLFLISNFVYVLSSCEDITTNPALNNLLNKICNICSEKYGIDVYNRCKENCFDNNVMYKICWKEFLQPL